MNNLNYHNTVSWISTQEDLTDKLKEGEVIIAFSENSYSKFIKTLVGGLCWPEMKEFSYEGDLSRTIYKLLKDDKVRGITLDSLEILKELMSKGRFNHQEKSYTHTELNKKYLVFLN